MPVAAPLTLAVTGGDPAGVGPEIIAKALADGRLSALGNIAVYAHPELFAIAAREAGLEALPVLDVGAEGPWPRLVAVASEPVPAGFALGVPDAFTGRVAAAAVRAAAGAALDRRVDAIVTAPLAKVALAAAGIRYPGHTEMLADLAGGASVAMMFVSGALRLTLATVHVPLADVSRRLDVATIVEKIRLTRDALIRRARIADPRIALLGVNPHAGEGGMFGDEERRIVAPAREAARAEGWRVEGPFPADSFFYRRLRDFDGVIAMYHDQGLIPVKLLSRGAAVNVTLGLPFLRTSVDHGTAFDIAGKGVASADSLVSAARLAAEWTAR